MPCSCWYEPPEPSKKLIKKYCEMIVNEINYLESVGDPIGVSIEETKKLLDHLYRPSLCEENPRIDDASIGVGNNAHP